jgi:hypothetical protein
MGSNRGSRQGSGESLSKSFRGELKTPGDDERTGETLH